jgi:hypothetical protein
MNHMERFAYCVILIFSSQKFYVPGKRISLEGVFTSLLSPA